MFDPYILHQHLLAPIYHDCRNQTLFMLYGKDISCRRLPGKRVSQFHDPLLHFPGAQACVHPVIKDIRRGSFFLFFKFQHSQHIAAVVVFPGKPDGPIPNHIGKFRTVYF